MKNGATEVHILLVEDNPGDVRLTLEALRDGKISNQVSVAHDGEEALDFLRRRGQYAEADRPDLVLLDLNPPRRTAARCSRRSRPTPSCTAFQ